MKRKKQYLREARSGSSQLDGIEAGKRAKCSQSDRRGDDDTSGMRKCEARNNVDKTQTYLIFPNAVQ